MRVLQTISAMRGALGKANGAPCAETIGLVPTMGALHEGHLSLVRRARGECTVLAASLFVNPTQFGPNEDFSRYPRRPEADFALFEAAGVDLVFAPEAEEMYPTGATTFVDVGEIGQRLDGAHRPGHFRGVATVVAKLFHIVQPHRAYFGQKDAVQVAVLRRMATDLNVSVEIVSCPIVRDPDGLALSSRNVYLSSEERGQGLALSRSLATIRGAIVDGERSRAALLSLGMRVLREEPAVEIEYLDAVDPQSLLPVKEVLAGTLVAVAARVGKTRLIDNFITGS